MSNAAPHISLRRDGPFYRVRVSPADALPPPVRQPETHAGHASALMAARLIANATGFPIIDETQKGGA